MNHLPALSNNIWYYWCPAVGIDPSLSDDALMIGAAIYAKLKSEGKSEIECHIEAEKAAFIYQYDIKY